MGFGVGFNSERLDESSGIQEMVKLAYLARRVRQCDPARKYMHETGIQVMSLTVRERIGSNRAGKCIVNLVAK